MKCLVSEKLSLFLNIYPELGLEKQFIGKENMPSENFRRHVF